MADTKENRQTPLHIKANTSGRPQGRGNDFRKGVTPLRGKFTGDTKHNSFCLTACGCFDRHNIPREEQYLNEQENRHADLATFNRTEFKERQLVSMVAVLQKQGCSLLPEETLEQYVMRHKDKLNQEHIEYLERSIKP